MTIERRNAEGPHGCYWREWSTQTSETGGERYLLWQHDWVRIGSHWANPEKVGEGTISELRCSRCKVEKLVPCDDGAREPPERRRVMDWGRHVASFAISSAPSAMSDPRAKRLGGRRKPPTIERRNDRSAVAFRLKLAFVWRLRWAVWLHAWWFRLCGHLIEKRKRNHVGVRMLGGSITVVDRVVRKERTP